MVATVTNAEMSPTALVEVPAHVAFMQAVPPTGTWHTWLQLARNATTFGQKLGLLHEGFDVEMTGAPYGMKKYTEMDRLVYYFGVADGWTQRSYFQIYANWQDEPEYYVGYDKNGNHLKRRESEQRQLLARKAFSMLISKFFVEQTWIEQASYNSHRDEHGEELIRRFLDSPEFLAIQQFFKIEERGIRNLTTHDDRHPQKEKVIEFLLRLPPLIWGWTEEEIPSYASKEEETKKSLRNLATAGIVAEAKLWMIEVLADLERLDLLEQWLRTFDGPTLKKLEEIALRAKFPGHDFVTSTSRLVASLDEACYLNSPAAWLLKKHHLKVAEYARLSAIREAEEVMDEAARRVAALTKPKQ